MKDKNRSKPKTRSGLQRSKQRSALNAGSVLDITERKETQAKNLIEDLTRSQQYFRALFNRTPSAVGISTVAEGRLCDVNEAFCRLTGYTREELLGRTTLALGLWADPSERGTGLREVQDQRYLPNREGLLRTKSGEIRALMVTVDSIQLGSTPCLIYLAHDITERKRMEQQLRRREQELDDFFENATVSLHWVGPEGIILRANRAELKLLGYAADEYVGHHIAEFHADQGVIDDILRRLTAGEELHDYEARLRCKDGSVRHVLINSNVLWEDGRFVHTRCFTHDITERKRAEEALKQSEERFGSLIRSTNDGIVMLDRLGLIAFWNPGADNLFGYAQEEVLGKPMTLLMPERFRERHERGIERASAAGHLTAAGSMFELVGLRKDGTEFPIELSLSSWSAGDGVFFTGIIRDITKRKREEEALRLAKFSVERAADAVYWIDAQAKILDVNEAASRMLGYSKDELCAMTVHDLNPEFQADRWPGFWAESRRHKTIVIESIHRAKDGRLIPIEVTVNFLIHEGKEYHCAFVRDITERKKSEQLEVDQKRVLELIAKDAPLSTTLEALVRMIEEQSVNRMVASILLMDADGAHLRTGAAPSLPESYNRAIDGIAVGPNIGSCGTAAYRRRPVYVSDIATDPLWTDFAALALSHHLRACWSTPICSSTARLLGTLAMYYPEVRESDEQDLRLVDVAVRLAAIAIERKQADETLQESEARFRMMADTAPVLIWMSGLDKLCGYFNQAWLDYTGRTMEQEIGNGWADGVHPSDLDRCLKTYGEAFARREPFEMEYRLRKADGQYGWVFDKGVPRCFPSGEFSGYIGSCIDITKRKQAEHALRESEERYRSIFEKAVDGIFQTTLDGKYVAVNPALARIYGYDSPDDLITAITDIAGQLYVDPGRRDEFLRAMQAQEEVTGFESLVYRKDGSFMWISESARTLRDLAGRVVGYEGTVEDITERKRAEGRLRVTLQHVRTLSKRLATVQEEERAHIARELHDELGVRLTCLKIDLSRVMSIVGHRVRADLHAKLNSRVRSMVGQVDSTIASLQQLVTQLRPAVLDDLGLVAAIEWQSRDFQKRTGISCTCATNADDIALEPERATAVFRIFQEALTNTARHAQATTVAITVTSQPDSLQLVVADNGAGVPETKVSDRRSLGLMGMQERAAQCGGTVTIEGDPEKGTTVTLRLPVPGCPSLVVREAGGA